MTDAVDGPCYQGAMHFRDGADASTEYEYDKNGNMTKDLNKGIAGIEYNSLNLPLNIRHNNGNMENYTYSAAGTKLCAISRTLSVGVLSPMTGVMQPSSAVSPRDGEIHFTYYCGNVIYDGNVTRILTDEGYVTFNGTTPVYHYYLKDHLGNNRVVLGQNGAVEQVNHYYPFGGLMGESIGGSTQPYKYNGKELDRTNGLDWCDYGARWYDATRIGWTSMDPLCEKYYDVSPYVYCGDNPIKFIDINGDSLDMNQVLLMDKTLQTNNISKINSDLCFVTGLSISISSDGYMQYLKDKNGEPVVNSNNPGSKLARNFLIGMIDGAKVDVFLTQDRSITPNGGNQVGLCANQIISFVKNANNIDGRTLGWGMTFLHELYHTGLGGSFSDNVIGDFGTGDVVDKMNMIRSELNSSGFNFGQRENYKAIFMDSSPYIPFNMESLSSLRNNNIPPSNSKFIIIK